jgi:Domain of unknown function (DUF6268)
MRWPRITLALLLMAGTASAQPPYPVTSTPPAWGGYPVAQTVPYQPTLPAAPPGEFAATNGYPPFGTPPTLAAPVTIYGPPTVDPNTGQVWQSYPGPGAVAPVADPIIVPPDQLYPSASAPSLRASLTPPDARDGVFQKAKFTGTWLPQLDDDNLGWTDLRSEVVLGLPFFTRENPIIITPSYELHFLDRPDDFDLPPRLHDLAIDFHIFRVFDNRWIFDFAVTPGVFADDHSFESDDALRVNGRALAIYAPTLEWKWVLGVTYVNGGWSKVVPVVGVVYEPNDDVSYELVFPRPRVAWRLPQSPVPGRDEYWFYMMGEFANSIWAFEQSSGSPDMFAYRDFRFILGLERKIIGGLSHRIEIGYVFNRDMKIASTGADEFGLDDTLLLRAGIVY